jgi:16S rRNA (uracil1498-N3)-methyltransferase
MPHRYYHEGPLAEGSYIELSKEESHHLKKVMRTKKGAELEIINGKGILAHATFDDEILIYKVTQQTPSQKKKALALALTEPKILELVIEKATEIGIETFYIFPTQKSKLRALSPNKQDRIARTIISATKQSKRLFLPSVAYFKKKEDLPKEENYLLADFDGKEFKKDDKSYTFIIGPESGFTAEEITYFKEELKALPLLLSDGVLRAETAAICAAHLLRL